MQHILVVSGPGNLRGRESSGSLGIPSKTSRFGKQDKTLNTQRKGRDRLSKRTSSYIHPVMALILSPCTVVLSEGHRVAGQVEGAQRAVPQSSQSPQGAYGILRQTKVLHCWELWQLTQTHQLVMVQVEHSAPAIDLCDHCNRS